MKKIISWIFGVFLVLFGFGAMGAGALLGGGIVLISGLGIIPPIKEKFKLPVLASVLFFFVGMGVSASKINGNITNEYNKNKNEIILSIKDKIEKKDYKSAISESEKYLLAQDKELESLNIKAKNLKEEEEKKKEEKIEKEELIKKTKKTELTLLSLLKRADDNDFISISDYYNQLTSLVPENEEYKSKAKEFDEKSKLLRKKKLKEKEAKLLVRVKDIPEENSSEKMDIYNKLSNIDPENKEYDEKYKKYKLRIEKIEKEKLMAKAGFKWDYHTTEDKMSGKSVKVATLKSTNTLSFKFPYRGLQHAILTLRKHPKHGKDVILSISKGQFSCGIQNCNVSVKFDDGKPKLFSAAPPSDHSSNTLFIKNYTRFVSKAKKSKSIYIQAEFYKEGEIVLEFYSKDLKF